MLPGHRVLHNGCLIGRNDRIEYDWDQATLPLWNTCVTAYWMKERLGHSHINHPEFLLTLMLLVAN